jgi:aminoglycoside phosphotransferase
MMSHAGDNRRAFDPHDPGNTPTELDAFQRELVLSACAAGSEIVEATPFRRGYRRYPLRVRVRTPEGGEQLLALKADPGPGKLEKEARLLPALAQLGLPVAEVLAGPAVHPEYREAVPMMVLGVLPGRPLPFVGATLDEMDLTCRLLIEAVQRLHGLTDRVRAHPVAAHIPKQTLLSALQEVIEGGGPWSEQQVFVEAVDRLLATLPSIREPLVFSNGDYNALNFLCAGDRLTGFLDFTQARFQDPYIGFAHYVIWSIDEVGWGAGRKAGLVERYLYSQNASRADFAPRLAIRCLSTLQSEIPVEGEECALYREHVLGLLRDSLDCLSQYRFT